MSRRATDSRSRKSKLAERLIRVSPLDLLLYGGVVFIAAAALFNIDSLHFCGG